LRPAAAAGNVPLICGRLLEKKHPDAFVGAPARHHDQSPIGLREAHAGSRHKLADRRCAGREVAQPAFMAHFDELAVLVSAGFESRMIHLLARTQAVVPKPVAHGHRAEQEFAAGLVGADNAQSTCLETIDAIEGRFGEPQTLTALQGSRARARRS
jgi:hypothetical protein